MHWEICINDNVKSDKFVISVYIVKIGLGNDQISGYSEAKLELASCL